MATSKQVYELHAFRQDKHDTKRLAYVITTCVDTKTTTIRIIWWMTI